MKQHWFSWIYLKIKWKTKFSSQIFQSETHEKNKKWILKCLYLQRYDKMYIKRENFKVPIIHLASGFFFNPEHASRIGFICGHNSTKEMECTLRRWKNLRGKYREAACFLQLFAFSCKCKYILHACLWLHPLNDMLLLYSVPWKKLLLPWH